MADLLTLTDAELLALTDADLLTMTDTGSTPVSSYAYYRDITFQPPSVALTHFPVLVRILNDFAMASRISSLSGYDIKFETLDGTALDYELDYYDYSTGSGVWWVRIPSLVSNDMTTIRMRYGNPSITTDQSSTSTWDTSIYHEILHYRNTSGVKEVLGNITDSGTSSGTTQTSTSPLGRELKFTGSSNYTGKYNSWGGTYLGYSSAMGVMSITQLAANASGFAMYRPMFNEVSSSYLNLCVTRGTSLYSIPRTTDWLAYGYTQYYKGSGLSQVNIVANGIEVLNDTQLVNIGNEATTYWAHNGSNISIAETRFYNTYVPNEWMQYEQLQILNHANYTAYDVEYNSDGTPVPAFTFRPWLYIPQRILT